MRVITLSICLIYLDGKLHWAGTASYQEFIQNAHTTDSSLGLPAGDTVIQIMNNVIHHDLTSGVGFFFNLGYPR